TPRWQLSGSMFSANDSNAVLTGMTARSLVLSNIFRFTPVTSLLVQTTATSFNARGADLTAPAFADQNKQLTSILSTRRGNVTYNGEVGLEAVTRSADLDQGIRSVTSGARATWRGTAEVMTNHGAFQFENSYERAGAGA